MSKRFVVVMLLLLELSWFTSLGRAEDFAFKDGDTVVFLGDSITEARTYGKYIENYTLLRFPERKIHFVNSGIGGDTAAGALARLERDVFGRGATVVTVAFGINDIGWGTRADAEHKKTYLDSITEIVKQCRSRGVRVYICSAAVTGTDPAKTERDFLQTMCDEAMKISRDLGGNSIDVQRGMREIQKRVWKSNESIKDASKKESLHTADGVHLNDMGQLAMAFAFLKGLNAPSLVSSVTIDAKSQKLIASEGCQVQDIQGSPASLRFTRLDQGLPLGGHPFFALNFRFIPIGDELNQYLLKVKSLRPGQYNLVVDGRKVGTWPADQLEHGVNISSSSPDPWHPGGPWDAQAFLLHSLTDSRNQLEQSANFAIRYLTEQKLTPQYLVGVKEANSKLEELQKQITVPRPYQFVIEPVTPEPASKR